MTIESELLALADHVERLTKPCRDADAQIAMALGYKSYEATISGVDRAGPWSRVETRWRSPDGFNNQNLAVYTFSIDAAMALLPAGWETAIYLGGEMVNVQMETPAMRSRPMFEPIEATAPTPALAVTAAALRVHAQEASHWKEPQQ